VGHTGGSTIARHIWMKSGNPGTGPGFIGGNVSQGANKGTGGGIPGMLLFVRDALNNVVTMTYTDNNGDYSFTNLPAGNYTVYPEDMNYTNIPSATLTITCTQTNVTGIDFERTNLNRTIQPKTTAIGNVAGVDLFSIYPNPSEG